MAFTKGMPAWNKGKKFKKNPETGVMEPIKPSAAAPEDTVVPLKDIQIPAETLSYLVKFWRTACQAQGVDCRQCLHHKLCPAVNEKIAQLIRESEK